MASERGREVEHQIRMVVPARSRNHEQTSFVQVAERTAESKVKRYPPSMFRCCVHIIDLRHAKAESCVINGGRVLSLRRVCAKKTLSRPWQIVSIL